MEYRQFDNIYVVRLDRGEEIVEKLTELAEKEDIRLAKVEGLGAASSITAGLYNVQLQKYFQKELQGPLEITSLIGNITRKDGQPYLHLHISAADQDTHQFGGHLTRAVIGGTGEIFVTAVDGSVGRKVDDITGTGLNLFDFQ